MGLPVMGWVKASSAAWRAGRGMREGILGAVEKVPGEGVAQVGHVDPDLVGAAGLQRQTEQGAADSRRGGCW